MIEKIKTDLCSLVRALGYNITDNGAYVENFPWLMLRVSRYNNYRTATTIENELTLIIDIFSTYKGEKEVLDIVSDITNHIWELKDNNPDIIYICQKDLKIIDDKKTGPVKKHGVVYYSFTLSSSIGEEGIINDTTGD